MEDTDSYIALTYATLWKRYVQAPSESILGGCGPGYLRARSGRHAGAQPPEASNP
ncbi:MAG: hypothetical protein M1357_00430 [Candidatus Marsarchaeota archaeon]|nr:hypothetical protein [Candidatus Marsarchaeota archaeon]